ncbi:hypothetical protein [Anaerosinus massiliensis]|nr:hypothetical protein [Massilibacillus massiliensis]
MELTVVISPPNGSWEEAEKIIKKICEAHIDVIYTLRIEVNDVSN